MNNTCPQSRNVFNHNRFKNCGNHRSIVIQTSFKTERGFHTSYEEEQLQMPADTYISTPF